MMQFLIGAGIIGIILYFLFIGGILIWPLINVIAYLKVLIFNILCNFLKILKLAVLISEFFKFLGSVMRFCMT